jgi:general secretion pathway protein J
MSTSKDRSRATIGAETPAIPAVATQPGFTLVEVLVAVSILSLLLLAVYGVFTTVNKTDQRLQTSSAGYHQARVLFDRIGREIRGAYRDAAAQEVRFRGGVDNQGYPFLTLTTTAVTPQGRTHDGVAVVHYQLQPDPESKSDRKMLIRQEYPLRDNEGENRQGYRLITDVEQMQLRFFDGSQWLEQWENEQGSRPLMVELYLVLSTPEALIPFRSAFEVPAIQVR